MLVTTLSKWLIDPTEKITDKRTIVWLSLSLIYAAIFGIAALFVAYQHDYSIQDDARIHVTWLLRYIDPELFPNDYLADYYIHSVPYAYLWLYRLFALVGLDAITVSKILPPIIGMGATIYGFLLAFELLPVPLVGFLASAFLNQLLWNYDTIITATPRAFGALFFLATLYYFIKGSRWLFLGMIFLLGGFYQVLLLPLFCVLFLQLFVWKNGLPRRLNANNLWLCLSGLSLIVLIISYYLLIPAPYGSTVTKEQALGMKEFQAGGRVQFFFFDSNKFFDPKVFRLNNSRSGMTPKRIFQPAILYLGFLLPILLSYSSYFSLAKKLHRKATLILQLIIVSLGLFILAHLTLFTLYLPNRYALGLQYSSRLLTALVVVILLEAILRQLQNWSNQESKIISFLVNPALWLSLLGGILIVFLGFSVHLKHYVVEGKHPDLYQFVQQQPKDTMLASFAYEASNIPSFTQRSVLVAREFALPYELGYYEQFRERTLDLIEAHYSANPEQVKDFIEKYKVSYFLLEKDAFKPSYITESLLKQDWLRPFPDQLKAVEQQLQQGTIPFISQSAKSCTVFEDEQLNVVQADCLLSTSKK